MVNKYTKLTYSLFSACPGLIFIGEQWKNKTTNKKRVREIGSSLVWHARKNSNSWYTPKKLHRQNQPRLTKFLHSLFPVLDIAVITRWENVSDFGRKCIFKPGSSKDGTFNLGSPLKTKGITPEAMFKLPQIFQKWYVEPVTQVWLSREPVPGRVQQRILASCWMIAQKQKGYDQFRRISNNNTEYVFEIRNFDVTQMLNKHCFCDSNIPSSHGRLHLSHFPRSIILIEYKN